MQIIATNQNDSPKKPSKFWPTSLVAATVAIILLIMLGGQYTIVNIIAIPLAGYLFLSLIFTVRNWMSGQKLPFSAYVDNGHFYVDFIKENDRDYSRETVYGTPAYKTPVPEEKKYCFNPEQIIGYKLRTFFKKPSILELQLDEGTSEILNVIIPIDSLSRRESKKLIDFIEQIIPHQTVNLEKRLQ